MMAGGTPLRLAHRGDWRTQPENSLAAFSAAMAIPGCDGIEFDVRLSSDGIPVVCHDDTLARVHGRPERVDGLPAGELASLGIPLLDDVLATVERRAFLDIELKAELGLGFVQLLAARRGPDLARSVVSSFSAAALERIAKLAPHWPRWFIGERLDPATLATAADLGCRAVAVGWRSIDERTVELARAAELDVVAWTVTRRSTFERLARLGVAAICVEGAALDAARRST